MKEKQIEALESYFKTDNAHWNGFTFKILCEVLQLGQFETPEIPLQLFNNSIDTFMEYHEQPIKAVQLFTGEMNKFKLNPQQKLFLYEWVCKYIAGTEYDDMDLTPIKDILNSYKEKLKTESLLSPSTKNIREILKELMQKELNNLPDTLKGLEPAQRLSILCKLIPYVLPKIESIHHTEGESTDFTVTP